MVEDFHDPRRRLRRSYRANRQRNELFRVKEVIKALNTSKFISCVIYNCLRGALDDDAFALVFGSGDIYDHLGSTYAQIHLGIRL